MGQDDVINGGCYYLRFFRHTGKGQMEDIAL